MGMQLAEMQRYQALDPSQRAQTELPGSHPPVKGFYFLKSASLGPQPPARSSSTFLMRLRHPKRSSSSISILPGSPVTPGIAAADLAEAEKGVLPQLNEGEGRSPLQPGTAASKPAADMDEAEQGPMSELNGKDSNQSLQVGTTASRGAAEVHQAAQTSDALPCQSSTLHDREVPPEPKSRDAQQHASSEHVAIDVAEP